jgi:hypothetical protein
MTPFPIPGMTVHPDTCNGAEPALDWPGFRGCVHFAFTHTETREAFEKEAGIDLLASSTGTPTERAAILAKFADWVAVKIWGVEE